MSRLGSGWPLAAYICAQLIIINVVVPAPWPRHGPRPRPGPGPGPGSRIYSPIPDANADTKAPKYFLVASKRNCLWKFMITIFMSHCIFHMVARGREGECRPHVGMVHGLWLLNECRMRFIYMTRRLAIAFHGGKWRVAGGKRRRGSSQP